MTKRRRLYVASCVLLAVMAMALLVVSVVSNPGERVYEGKLLSFWLTDRINESQARRKAAEAMRHIGTNAIPTLLRMTKARRASPLKRKLLELAYKQSLIRIREGPDAFHQQYGAEYGFEILGTNAVAAVPELIKICADWRYPESQETAAFALGCIGPGAMAAIPVLLKNLTHTNANVRSQAVAAIASTGGDPNIIVPALRAALKDPERNVRLCAVYGLPKFRKEALAAIPELIEARQDPDQEVRDEIDNVLWDLAPEKIAKPLVVEEHTPMVAAGVTTQTLSRLEGGELYAVIRPGTRVRYVRYQSVADQPIYLYRGSTLKSSEDYFLGHFEVVPRTSPATNINIEVVYIVENERILLCARDYRRKEFVELRRVEDETVK